MYCRCATVYKYVATSLQGATKPVKFIVVVPKTEGVLTEMLLSRAI